MIILSDRSCFILLEKIGHLHLLYQLFGRVVVTQAVADEFGHALPEWVAIQNPTELKTQQVLEASLDKGEASTLALALEQDHCLVIMDEAKGRQ